MKYIKLMDRIEKLENETYGHSDHSEEMYDSILQIVATAKPQSQEQEEQIIYDTLYLLENMHYERLIYEPLRDFELNETDNAESILFDFAKKLKQLSKLETFPFAINDSESIIHVGNLFRIIFKDNILEIEYIWHASNEDIFSLEVTKDNRKDVLQKALETTENFLDRYASLLK